MKDALKTRAKNIRFNFLRWVFEICIWPKKGRLNNQFNVGEVYIYYTDNRTRSNIRYMIQIVERGEEWFKCKPINLHYPDEDAPTEHTFRMWDAKWERQKNNFEFIGYANKIREAN